VDVVAVGGAVRAFAVSATFGHAHIRGLGTPRPLFVARPLSKVERARRRRVLRRRNAELCARAGKRSGRLANRNGSSVSVSQREFVSLLRVVGVGVGSTAVMVQVAISQQ
jgi:hypothetical protein